MNVAQDALREAREQGKKKAIIKKFNHKTAYNRLSSEVQNIIETLNEGVASDNKDGAFELLQKIQAKLDQTMQIVRVDSWQ